MFYRRLPFPYSMVVPALMISVACLAVWMTGSSDSQAETTAETDVMVVHEWGTFTELQNEAGLSLTGINTDDEPVPAFVHGVGPVVLAPTVFPEQRFGKRIPFRHWQVATRLETPVIYFYPPDGADLPVEVDVEVGLREGWLTEFYPNADMEAPGLDKLWIPDNESGTLKWNGLQVGTEGRYPETQDPVWLNPRSTQSAGVTTASGESEKYLFYRGVGKFTGPLRVNLDREAGRVDFRPTESLSETMSAVKTAWLVDVRRDGSVAFQKIAEGETGTIHGSSTDYRFAEEQYDGGNLPLLKDQMHAALVEDGLFADEASAMLATWNNAYFRSPGLRVFYIVPLKWTDDRMPLNVSVQSHIERVMVGRIELISDEHRNTIDAIRETPVASAAWMQNITNRDAYMKMMAGQSDFGDLGVEIPEDYQRYLSLGRFRNAMLRGDQVVRPDQNLQQFLLQYGLNPPNFSFDAATAGEVKDD